MPTSPQKPEIPTGSPSAKAENDAPASTETSPRHEEHTKTMQTVLVKDGGNEADLPHGPEHTIPRPTKTVDCNMLSYTDGEGIARQIYMPKGTIRLACALHDIKRFDDLAKFPASDNQTYNDWEANEEKYAYLWDELGDLPNKL